MIKINNRIIKPEYFPDGTMKLNITFFDDFIKIKWYYDSENELLQLVYIVNHIHDISPDIKIYLIMPYIPNARFDRTVEVDEGVIVPAGSYVPDLFLQKSRYILSATFQLQTGAQL